MKKQDTMIAASNLQEEKKADLRGKSDGWLTTSTRFTLKNCVTGSNVRKKYIS